MKLKVSECSNQIVARCSRRIFGPPREDVGPHADHGLRENVGIEAVRRAAFCQAFATTRAHSGGQAFQDSRGDIARFSTGVKDDAKQIALLFRESNQRVRLGVHQVGGLGLGFGDSNESALDFVGRFFSEFSEELDLVLEVQIEGAGGVPSLGGDGVRRDGSGSVFREECQASLEKPLSGLLGFGQASAGAPGNSGTQTRSNRGATDGHVIYDVNVSFGRE